MEKPALKPALKPAGDSAVIIEWNIPPTPDLNRYITGLKSRLEQCAIGGIAEIVPAYSTLLVYYDPAVVEYSLLAAEINRALPDNSSDIRKLHGNKTVVIPVFYGAQYGPDLGFIAEAKNLAEEDVIRIHCDPVYYVYMIGFLPGFPYLGFVDHSISMGRKNQPREMVPAGSVGIAGRQTGIYSLASPGGWQIIGRTPIKLFRAEGSRFLLSVGDRVVFEPVGDGVRFTDIDPESWGDLYRNGEGD